MTHATKKSIIITSAVCALVGIMGAIAYFTDNDNATNSFSVGHVDIDLQETFDPAAATNLAPTSTVTKEPYVTNTSTVPSYIFMEVDVPVSAVYPATDAGAALAHGRWQVFKFTSTTSNPGATGEYANVNHTFNNKWTLVDQSGGSASAGSVRHYRFVYNNGQPVPASVTQTESLFDKVTVVNATEKTTSLVGKSASIGVTTYVIQAQGCTNYSDAYTKYVNQNS